jgi:hypothetical protein
MSSNKKPFDMGRFIENRRKIPWEHLLPYAGKHVAYSEDGTHIVASGVGYEELFKRMDELEIDGERVVIGYVPGLDEECWLFACESVTDSASA